MVSVIVSSKTDTLFQNFSNNLSETIGCLYEIIEIKNYQGKLSICEAYNKGAQMAKYPILCFCHEDISFKTQNWGNLLVSHFEDPKISLIGILGNIIKTKIPSGVFSSVQHTNRINQLQLLHDRSTLHYYTNPLNETISEVATLDGMFLATKHTYWKQYQFDQHILTGFHGYDVDFSLSMSLLGKVVVVYDILIEHFSFGGNTKDWVTSQLSIVQKWKNVLPIQHNQFNKIDLKLREIDDLFNFNITLLRLKYNLRLSYKYAIKLFLKKPFNRNSLSILKQVIMLSFNG